MSGRETAGPGLRPTIAQGLDPESDWTGLEQAYAASFRPFAGLLNPADLIAEAESAAGLADWGGERWSEAGFRRRLGSLCASLEEEAELSPIGRSRAHGRLHAMLVSRLRVCALHKARPVSPPIVAPLVGTGLPRSGTSFLHHLLAQDPDHLAARTARALIPVPPHGTLEEESRRDAIADRILSFQGLDCPAVNAIHPHGAGMTDEDTLLQEGACGPLYQGFFYVPGFIAGLAGDGPDFYAWQSGLMGLMQSSLPRRRWVLKAPAHMSELDSLLGAFPDARLVVNHRDPAKVIPSLASLYVTFRSLNSSRAVEPSRLGREVLHGQMHAIGRMNAWRDTNPGVRIVDIHYLDLVRDPIGEVERLYEAFDIELGGKAKQPMSDFLAGNPHGRPHEGLKHRYGPGDFGLSEDLIRKVSADYMARYGVAREKY